MPSPLRFKLVATILITFGSIVSYAQCKEIRAEAKIVTTSSDVSGNHSIRIEFNEPDPSAFQISFFVSNGHNILNSDKTEFNNLSRGKYLIVIVEKREDDNFCPKSINVTIN